MAAHTFWRPAARSLRRPAARSLRRPAAVLAGAVVLLTGCGSGDVTGSSGGSDAETTLTLVTYSAAEPGWDPVIDAFAAAEEGADVEVKTSYGPSAEQSRAVESGERADVVNFSVQPDITRLVEAGKVADDWNTNATRGIPLGSVVTFMVREGNPKNIRDWDDLLRPGVEVITPDPLSSGSAQWNLLAPYVVKSAGGQDRQAGLDYVRQLISEHIELRPGSGREATEVFLQGSGDVLLAYENEAINSRRQGHVFDHVIPPQTVKIENPVAAVITGQHVGKATEFVNFQFTPPAQRLWAEAGFRPVDPAVAADFAEQFPTPEKLWTVDDLGGWAQVDAELFDKDSGAIARMYTQAMG